MCIEPFSGEDTHPWTTDVSLRKVRELRRTRSAPGGLVELDNSAHVLSIGYVHRHRPFDAEYDVGEAVGTGGFAVGTDWAILGCGPIVHSLYSLDSQVQF